MALVQDLLLQFKKLYKDSFEDKECVIRAFKTVAGITIVRNDFTIKKGVITFISNPYLKSEIILHKEALLREMKKDGIQSDVRDIR